MTLTPAPGDQRMKDTLHIDTVGLHPPRPPVDLQAGRFHHLTSDIPLLKEPRQPKTVITGLVARCDRRRLIRTQAIWSLDSLVCLWAHPDFG